jgi:hypothetical protein
MSAQVIAALRRRADALESYREGPFIVDRSTGEPVPLPVDLAVILRALLVSEFRKLADEAEGHEQP